MASEQELFERALEAIADIAAVLANLKRDHPQNALIDSCIEVQEQLDWYANDAREKLRQNQFTENDATALALIVERGMDRMIRIVEAAVER